MECTICMDVIDLAALEDSYPLAVTAQYKHEEAEIYKKQLAERSQTPAGQLWITPCGHCFHAQCLNRWGEENRTCPEDRREIPEMPPMNWFE